MSVLTKLNPETLMKVVHRLNGLGPIGTAVLSHLILARRYKNNPDLSPSIRKQLLSQDRLTNAIGLGLHLLCFYGLASVTRRLLVPTTGISAALKQAVETTVATIGSLVSFSLIRPLLTAHLQLNWMQEGGYLKPGRLLSESQKLPLQLRPVSGASRPATTRIRPVLATPVPETTLSRTTTPRTPIPQVRVAGPIQPPRPLGWRQSNWHKSPGLNYSQPIRPFNKPVNKPAFGWPSIYPY